MILHDYLHYSIFKSERYMVYSVTLNSGMFYSDVHFKCYISAAYYNVLRIPLQLSVPCNLTPRNFNLVKHLWHFMFYMYVQKTHINLHFVLTYEADKCSLGSVLRWEFFL